jgi:hypothetical protein
MSLVRVYVAGYFVLVGGAVLALWQGGILSRISLLWLAMGLIVAIGLGLLLLVTSRRPPVHLE